MEPTTPKLARRLWRAIEPIHAIAYFDPGPTDALKALGLRGFWMSYFAGRFAPLGAVGPGPATAMAFGFAPRRVARALPDAWHLVPPPAVVAERLASAGRALKQRLPATSAADLHELVDLLSVAASACRCDGRPLAAGWLEVDPGDDLLEILWTRTTVLREHRGDGHVLAAVNLGLGGLDASLTHVATGAVPRDVMQTTRAWTDEEWDEGVRRLQERGLLDGESRLTETGSEIRGQLEETTDQLATEPVERLGEVGVERAIELAAPLSRWLVDSGVVPALNPIGVPRA